MFKLSATIFSLVFLGSSWSAGFSLPRFTHGPADYLLMPLFAYLLVIAAAQVAARIIPES